MRHLYTSVVGSHAWDMAKSGGNWDYYNICQVPTRDVFIGRQHNGESNSGGNTRRGTRWNMRSFEIEHHIGYLIEGNVSHIISVFAPAVAHVKSKRFINPNDVHLELRRILTENPSKNIFFSINKSINRNLKRYFEKFIVTKKGRKIKRRDYIPPSPGNEGIRRRKLTQMRRVLRFGYNILLHGTYEMNSSWRCSGGEDAVDALKREMWVLKDAYGISNLPKKPDRRPYEDLLVKLRMGYLDDITLPEVKSSGQKGKGKETDLNKWE